MSSITKSEKYPIWVKVFVELNILTDGKFYLDRDANLVMEGDGPPIFGCVSTIGIFHLEDGRYLAIVFDYEAEVEYIDDIKYEVNEKIELLSPYRMLSENCVCK